MFIRIFRLCMLFSSSRRSCSKLPTILSILFWIGFSCLSIGCTTDGSSAPLPPQLAHLSSSVRWSQSEFRHTLPSRSDTLIRFHVAMLKKSDDAPAILFLPGAGPASRFGTRTDNGLTSYPAPIEVTSLLMAEAAQQGFLAMAYDKRTCGPDDDPRCNDNVHSDIDELGPQALSSDVDRACEILEKQSSFNGQIVLWAHGQSGQVALTSTCMERAQALVLVAPIPRRVDRVMVDALYARAQHPALRSQANANRSSLDEQTTPPSGRAIALKNKASSLAETFTALSDGRFSKDAKLWGVEASFWTNWIQLTDDVPGPNPKPSIPWLVVLGENDGQFSPGDKKRIAKWGNHAAIQLMKLPAVDHHLIADNTLGTAQIAPIFRELMRLLSNGAT